MRDGECAKCGGNLTADHICGIMHQQSNPFNSSDVKAIMKSTAPIFDFIYENEKNFLDTFAGINVAWMLSDVSLTDESINYTYVVDSGQHIYSHITIKHFIEWMEKINEKTN